MVATKLSSALVAPSKVANLLDWRKAVGSVMALDITRKSIGMAVATHPDQHAEAVALRPISLMQQQHHHRGEGAPSSSFSLYKGKKKNLVSKELISELEAVVRRHRVCAFVVNWPTHEGRMGEQCGKVLHVLDSVIDQSNSVVTRKRPFTLWSSTTTRDCHHYFNDDEHTSSSLSLSSSVDDAHSSSPTHHPTNGDDRSTLPMHPPIILICITVPRILFNVKSHYYHRRRRLPPKLPYMFSTSG